MVTDGNWPWWLTAIGAVVGWKLATALNGTTGVGEGLAPAPDDEAVLFDAGVEVTTALAGVANGVGVGMSCRVAGVLPGVATATNEAVGEELPSVVDGVAVAIDATAFGVEVA
jgi:hypothetical protein